MAISHLGRRVTGPEQDIAEIGSGQQRACVFDAATQTVIVYKLGAWVGNDESTPEFRIGWGTASGGGPAPDDLLAYTAEMTATALYVDITGGASYEGAVAPFIVQAGSRSAGVLTARNGVLGVSMRQAAAITAGNENFYTKSGLGSTVPTDPIGGSPAINGHLSVWATGDANDPPAVPTALSPAGTITNGDLTPLFTSGFADPNETLSNGQAFDYLNQVQIIVERVSDGAVMWSHTYTASSGERTAKQASVEYAGTTLVRGTAYRQRVRHSDRSGAWSPYTTNTTFTISNAGSVAQPSSPSGKQNTRTPGPFTAVWSHASGLAMAGVAVNIYSANGVLTRTMSVIPKSVANGGTISVTWAETGFAALSWGTGYEFGIVGVDTAGAISQESPRRAFTTNAAPAVPSGLSPANNGVLTAYPVLRCTVTDADGDALTVKARIKSNAGAVLFTRTMTRVGTTNSYTYQTTATDLATYTTYRWDAYAYDGTLYSGATTVEADAAKSTEAVFQWADGPDLTVTAPTVGQVLTSRTITVSWTAPTQVKRQVFLSRPDGFILGATALDTTTEQTITVTDWPLQFSEYGDGIRNQTDYGIWMQVRDAADLIAYSPVIPIRVEYPPATMIAGFVAAPTQLPLDNDPTAVLCTWEPTTYPASEFIAYDLLRVPLSAPQGDPVGSPVWLRRITSPIQLAYLDAEAVSSQAYEWQLLQTVRVGADEVQSLAATSQALLDFGGVVIGSVLQPETYHLEMRYASSRGDEGEWTLGQDVSFVRGLGAQKSRAIRGAQREWDFSGEYRLLSDDAGSAEARERAFRAIAEHGGTLCIRDGRGNREYVALSNARIRQRAMKNVDLALAFRNVDWQSGETGVQALIDVLSGLLGGGS